MTRQYDVPRHESLADLSSYIDSLVHFEQGGGESYNLSAEAMVKASVATFSYVARQVGATGFQAEWAALTFYAEVLSIDGPLMVTRGENALYPQYDLPAMLQEFLDDPDVRKWLKEQAQAKIAEYEANGTEPSGRVFAHWKELAAS